ncbi:MAG TPA: protein-methionine-sulfoxide reductase heme-binding subunit MsrQ [bacterium]|nr:protein-methionine-sulfoxide reductase heme-binding subunit MsrQ [bacterium]
MDARDVRRLVERKWLVFALALVPALLIAVDAWRGHLSADPIKEVEHRTGDWTLRFLLLTLAISPLVGSSGWNWPRRARRMLGLFAFFYGVTHLTIYFGLDQGWIFGTIDLQDLKKDLFERKYIIAGMSALLLMLPLAVTSNDASVRRLGGDRWRLLHRLAYVSAALGVLHYYWLVKASHARPLTYAAIFALLMAWRAWHFARRRVPAVSAAPPAP